MISNPILSLLKIYSNFVNFCKFLYLVIKFLSFCVDRKTAEDLTFRIADSYRGIKSLAIIAQFLFLLI